MLTADLVQAAVRGGEVQPRYIGVNDKDALALAGHLIGLFDAHVGRTKGALDTALKDYLGSGTAFLLHRGLAKLLTDRSEFTTRSEVDPEELRRAVFLAAARVRNSGESLRVDRSAVFAEAGSALGVDPAICESNLYADLKDEQVLERFKSVDAPWLLNRYNLALAQAVLLRATELIAQIPPQTAARYRDLFRQIKFCQLLYRVEGTADEGYTLFLDGPVSLFKSSNRYGVQMANFLPTLIHCEGYALAASVRWGKKRTERVFRLSSASGLVPPRHQPGQWQPEEMAWLKEQFPKLGSDWTASTETELVDLGGRGVLVPDYVFRHPDGRVVYMELFGYWRKGAVESRVELLREHGPENLILGLSKELAADREGLDELPGSVYVFRTTPIAREVLKLLEGMT